MSYDSWKTTEPGEQGSPCEQCGTSEGAVIVEDVRLCDDCANDAVADRDEQAARSALDEAFAYITDDEQMEAGHG